MNRLIIFFNSLLLICISLSCTAQKERIKNVETNLIPAFVINGLDAKPLSIEEGMEKYKVPAVSIAFFDNGEIKWTKSYGTISKGNSKLINEGTLFQAASVSKPVTSLATMRLVQAGKFALDENVNNYLNDWKLENENFEESTSATLRNLLAHAGGITVSGFEGYRAGTNLPNLLQILNGQSPANSKKVIQETNGVNKWKYSSGGYAIIQKLIEEASNHSFQDYMQNEVLAPIGMTSSTFSQVLPNRLKENVAFGHDGEGNLIEGNWNVYPEQAAAGLWTTPTDLALFAISLQRAYAGKNEQIINQKSMQSILEDQGNGWGLGIDISNKGKVLRFMHGGANEGYRCQMVAEANLGQGVAIMTNGVGGELLIQDLLRGISKEYDWNIYKAREKNITNLSSREKEKLTGKYFMVDNNQVVVEMSATEKGIKVMQTWNGQSYQIFPEDNLQFFRETDGTPIEFKENEEGNVFTFVAGGALLFEKL